MFTRMAAFGLAVGLLSIAAAADAQEVATSFDQLRLAVRLGDTIKVVDGSGHEISGRVLNLTSSSLDLRTSTGEVRLAEDDVHVIRVRRHGDLGHGAKWGFGVGAALGALAGAEVSSECRGCGAV